MKFALFTPPPVPQPPQEITLKLSVEEALIFLHALGTSNGSRLSGMDKRIDANNVYKTYDKFKPEMVKAGLVEA